MAMNKAEKAELARLQKELLLARAWRRTEAYPPDISPPDGFSELSRGWHAWASETTQRVEKGCSSSVFHSTSGWDKTTSQQTIHLHSTRLAALRHMRWLYECTIEKRLASIDEDIADELANPTPGPEEK
jgi:hypothetical protein